MQTLNKKQLHTAIRMLSDSLPNGWPRLKDALNEIDHLLKSNNYYMIVVVEKVWF